MNAVGVLAREMRASSGSSRRYATVLLGVHIGDCLGLPVETWTPDNIHQQYGRIDRLHPTTRYRKKDGTIVDADQAPPEWSYNSKIGDPSDDTILTLAMAQTLTQHGYDLEHAAQAHVMAVEGCRKPDGTLKGGFGKTTLGAIKRLAQGIPPEKSGIPGVGNAPPMKMSPVGLYMHATSEIADGLRFAEQVGRMTHLDSTSIAAGVMQAAAIDALLYGIDKKGFLETTLEVANMHNASIAQSLAPQMAWVAGHPGAPDSTALRVLGNDSRAAASYPFTVFMTLRYWDDPFEGLLATVNCGGDCDSTGAMYGALAAANHGRFWPKSWEEQLRYREEINDVAARIADIGARS